MFSKMQLQSLINLVNHKSLNSADNFILEFYSKPNGQVTKLLDYQIVTKLLGYQIISYQIIIYQIVKLPNCQFTKLLVTKLLVTKMLVTKLLVTNNPPIDISRKY